jgi:methanogenic corrinoid protein MtbC1
MQILDLHYWINRKLAITVMLEILDRLSEVVESGKVDARSNYPSHLKGFDGACEITDRALRDGITPKQILYEALIPAMNRVGVRFSEKEIFVPQMLMSAKTMGACLVRLKPFFISGELERRGTFTIGTVKGDLHDIGKNLVSIMIEGGGWKVVDLGVDVDAARILRAIEENPGTSVGLSALLTTTLESMRNIVARIKDRYPDTPVLIGGAPVSDRFCRMIGADYYSPDPRGAINYLSGINEQITKTF